jgi:hypothetical protein
MGFKNKNNLTKVLAFDPPLLRYSKNLIIIYIFKWVLTKKIKFVDPDVRNIYFT